MCGIEGFEGGTVPDLAVEAVAVRTMLTGRPRAVAWAKVYSES